MALGMSGPVLRSTGYPWDLRKMQPYCGYETYEFDVPRADLDETPYGRFLIRLEEMQPEHAHRRAVPSSGCVRDPVMVEEDKEDPATAGAAPASGPDGIAWLPGAHPAHHGPVGGSLIPPLPTGTEGFRVPGRPTPRHVSRRPRRNSACMCPVSDGGTRPYRVHFRDPSFNKPAGCTRDEARAVRSPTWWPRWQVSTRHGWVDRPDGTDPNRPVRRMMDLAARYPQPRTLCCRCCTWPVEGP